MANMDDRNINLTIKNEPDEKDEVVISLSGIFKKLRKYLLLWIVTAVVIGGLVFGSNALTIAGNKPALSALVSFNYDGVEEGLDPAGGSLDANTIKNPSVITAALATLGLYDEYANQIENIRAGIKVIPVTPTDAIDRMTVYRSVMENSSNGNLTAAQALLDVTYFPTQYKVTFNYSGTSLGRDQAVEVFNQILDSYRTYFYGQYGYNRSVGTSVTVINYEDYDYAEAVDIFTTALDTLETYIKQLSKEESEYINYAADGSGTSTRFRSNATGYTFDDLAAAIETVKSIDLDRVSSNITVNNLTKNKEDTIAYYQYRIQALKRQQTQYTEVLTTIKESIESYEKDVIMVFGNGSDNTNTTSTQASAEYDKLIDQYISTQQSLSSTTQQIAFYEERKSALEKSSATISEAKLQQVEEQFDTLYAKVTDLVDKVNDTADEYFENVAFANAYSVLVPAVSSGTATITSMIKASFNPILIAEALLFVIYIAVSFIMAIIDENKKGTKAVAAANTTASGDAPEPETDEPTKAEEEGFEDKKDNGKKKK